MKHPAVAIVRGKFLNRYEMQTFEPLASRYRITAFGSLAPLHDAFAFPVVKLLSPMDLPNVPYKMPVINRVWTDAQYLYGLEKKLRGFNLVHTAETYFRYTQQCLDAKKHGWVRKVIATVWETIPHNNEGIWGRPAYKARARRELDHIIAVTEKAKAALVSEGADPHKISVIGAHVDTARFAPEKGWLAHLSDPKRRLFTILFCGRLVSEKGVPEILAAAPRIVSEAVRLGYRIQWVFVGNGPWQQAIANQIRVIGKNWHSTIESATYDQMPRLYRTADIFIAPSKPTRTWEEQYGMALLEAQSSGLPIVTTNSGGIPENVGDAAVLVPPSDSDALAREITAFLTSPKKRAIYAARARKRAVSRHDIRVGAQAIARVYERVFFSR